MMSYKLALLAAVAALPLTACSESKVETATVDPDSKVEISISAGDEGEPATGDGGSVEVKLPGGLGAKVDVPQGLGNDAKFDIDGVGLYPGAKVGAIAVNASKAGTNGGRSVVDIGFSAPADAAVVADWYEQKFAEKKIAIQRKGETLTGKTNDGDDFTLAMTPSNGGSKGKLNIRDAG